jgi:hypothetical protein
MQSSKKQGNKHIATNTVTLHIDEMSNARKRKTSWSSVSWISRNTYPIDV